MSKKLNTDAIASELSGSVFFQRTGEDASIHAPSTSNVDEVRPAPRPKARRPAPQASVQPTSESLPASELASMLASGGGVIEIIRKTVKQSGREVSFVRLTAEEKSRIGDIIYEYKRQGVKTTENEINRIAVNFLLEDYERHGDASVLARVLAALRA